MIGHRLRIPLEHLREEKLTESRIGFGFGHEIKELVSAAQERIADAVLQLCLRKNSMLLVLKAARSVSSASSFCLIAFTTRSLPRS
jgi:hypothetical protein